MLPSDRFSSFQDWQSARLPYLDARWRLNSLLTECLTTDGWPGYCSLCRQPVSFLCPPLSPATARTCGRSWSARSAGSMRAAGAVAAIVRRIADHVAAVVAEGFPEIFADKRASTFWKIGIMFARGRARTVRRCTAAPLRTDVSADAVCWS